MATALRDHVVDLTESGSKHSPSALELWRRELHSSTHPIISYAWAFDINDQGVAAGFLLIFPDLDIANRLFWNADGVLEPGVMESMEFRALNSSRVSAARHKNTRFGYFRRAGRLLEEPRLCPTRSRPPIPISDATSSRGVWDQ